MRFEEEEIFYIISSHAKRISKVKFEPQEEYFLSTTSFDMTAKIWSSCDFKPVKTLFGHEEKVSSLDITRDGQYIATVAFDRTIKLWSSKSSRMEKQAMAVD